MIGLLLSVAAAEEPACDQRFTTQDLTGLINQAESAFTNLDADAFAQSRDALSQLECVSEPLPTSVASGWFRVRALDAHLRRAPEDLLANAAAFAEIDPTPPSSVVAPKGHPVRNAWEIAREAGASPTRLLDVPLAGRVRIDGRDTLDLPTGRPSLYQFIDQDGKVAWTHLATPGQEKLPTYEITTEDHRAAYTNMLIVERPRKPIALPILAGVAAAGSIASFSAAGYTRHRFLKTVKDGDRLEGLKRSNNALNITGASLGVAALGLGVWTAVEW